MLLRLSINLPGFDAAESLRVPREQMECVGDLKKAIISEFRLDVAPQQMQLFKLNGATRTRLDPTQTLRKAGVVTAAVLEVEVAVQAPAALQTGVCLEYELLPS